MRTIPQVTTGPEDWRGALFVGSGWLLYSGPVGPASLHHHHAVQAVVARSGVVDLVDGKGHECQGAAVQVGSDRDHAMHHALPSGYLLYIEADSAIARSIPAQPAGMRAWSGPGAALHSVLSAAEPRSLDSARSVARGIVALLAPDEPPRQPRRRDPLVRRAVAMVPSLIAELGSELRLPAIAQAVGRSPDRFARTFNEEVGMSIPAYVRWARLRFVARSIARGRTLTGAAQEAGFSDSAHLSRVFRETFGVRPSDLATCTRWTVGDIELE